MNHGRALRLPRPIDHRVRPVDTDSQSREAKSPKSLHERRGYAARRSRPQEVRSTAARFGSRPNGLRVRSTRGGRWSHRIDDVVVGTLLGQRRCPQDQGGRTSPLSAHQPQTSGRRTPSLARRCNAAKSESTRSGLARLGVPRGRDNGRRADADPAVAGSHRERRIRYSGSLGTGLAHQGDAGREEPEERERRSEQQQRERRVPEQRHDRTQGRAPRRGGRAGRSTREAHLFSG